MPLDLLTLVAVFFISRDVMKTKNYWNREGFNLLTRKCIFPILPLKTVKVIWNQDNIAKFHNSQAIMHHFITLTHNYCLCLSGSIEEPSEKMKIKANSKLYTFEIINSVNSFS